MYRTLKLSRSGIWSISYIEDGEINRMELSASSHENVVFHEAAWLRAYADLYDISSVIVHHNGHRYYYAGWQPDMLIEFVNEIGVVVWSGRYPEWDH